MYTGRRCFLTSVLLVLIIISVGWVEQAQCQEKYPTKPIDIIYPFPPGTVPDAIARLAATYLNKKWSVPVNVINKPGSATIVANMEVYRAAPDGYTVFFDQKNSCSVLERVMKDLPFKIMDRTFLGMICSGSILFVVPSSTPYKSLEDVIKDAKRDPGNFTWGSVGGATGQDIATRQFFKVIGVDVRKTKPVMGKGAGELIVLASGGHIKLTCGSLFSIKGPAEAGLIRVLTTTGKERYPEFPDVPTSAELGYPKLDYVHWQGFTGPPNMPSYVIDIWTKALEEWIKDPEFISRMKSYGQTISYLNSRELREFVKKEIEELKGLYQE